MAEEPKKSKILGIPLVLILLVLGIIVPLIVVMVALHMQTLAEIKKLKPQVVTKTLVEKVVVTPTVTPKLIKKLPVATKSADTK